MYSKLLIFNEKLQKIRCELGNFKIRMTRAASQPVKFKYFLAMRHILQLDVIMYVYKKFWATSLRQKMPPIRDVKTLLNLSIDCLPHVSVTHWAWNPHFIQDELIWFFKMLTSDKFFAKYLDISVLAYYLLLIK